MVAGIYGFNARGFVALSDNDDPPKIQDNLRQAGTGIVKLRKDGTATFTVERFFSVGVTNLPQPVKSTFHANWSINPDCTGAVDLMEFGVDVGWVFVAVENANELHLVSGATLTAVDAKRIANRTLAKPHRRHKRAESVPVQV